VSVDFQYLGRSPFLFEHSKLNIFLLFIEAVKAKKAVEAVEVFKMPIL